MSAMTDDARNIPVPDELAQVRDEIKRLETRNAELKQILLSDPSARTGNNFAAEIQEVTIVTVDIKELRGNYPDIVEQFTFPHKTSRIMLRKISEDGELLSFRRKTRQ